MKKKTKNPFKMGGSWIGAGIITLFFISEQFFCKPYIDATSVNFCFQFIDAPLIIKFIFILIIILGFLIGWGIHSLLRKYTKIKI